VIPSVHHRFGGRDQRGHADQAGGADFRNEVVTPSGQRPHTRLHLETIRAGSQGLDVQAGLESTDFDLALVQGLIGGGNISMVDVPLARLFPEWSVPISYAMLSTMR
jgi:hypothetical protein